MFLSSSVPHSSIRCAAPVVSSAPRLKAMLAPKNRSQARRRSLAAVLRAALEGDPAVLAEHLVRLVVRLGHRHLAVLELAALAITRGVGRGEHLPGELVGLVQDHLHVFLGELLVLLVFQQPLDVELLEQGKLEVSDVGDEVGHGFAPSRLTRFRSPGLWRNFPANTTPNVASRQFAESVEIDGDLVGFRFPKLTRGEPPTTICYGHFQKWSK
jgi:hypothetical protein